MRVIVVHTCCTFHVLEQARVCVLCQARGKTLGQGNIAGKDILTGSLGRHRDWPKDEDP